MGRIGDLGRAADQTQGLADRAVDAVGLGDPARVVPREADLVDVPRPASSISFATTRAVARTEVPRQTSMRKCLDRDRRRQTPLLSRTSGTLRPS